MFKQNAGYESWVKSKNMKIKSAMRVHMFVEGYLRNAQNLLSVVNRFSTVSAVSMQRDTVLEWILDYK